MIKSILTVLMVLLVGCVPSGVSVQPENDLTWSHTPVVVYVDATIPEVMRDGVHSAVLAWNTAVGDQVFEVYEISASSGHFVFAPLGSITVSSGELGTRLIDVGASLGEPLTDLRTVKVLGNADLMFSPLNGRAIHCMVLLDYEVNSETSHPVATHELGHCLGLGHDTNPDSIMYYTAIESPDQHILPEHVSRIRRMMR